MAAKGQETRPRSSDDAKKDMWSSMLDSVASSKRLPEKVVLVLGGSSETQQEFLEALRQPSPGVRRLGDYHNQKAPPIANQFALGYTYQDVLDAEHEDILARLSLYLLAEPSSDFMPLVKPLLTPQTLPNSMIVILLDWSQPWTWLRQLRGWIRLLRQLLVSLDEECKEVMEQTMVDWRDRGRGVSSLDGSVGSSGGPDGDIALPLGPGEWDEALGLPICVVCQNAEKMELLEKEHGWKDDEFDFVLLFLRTVLLKHGGSLIYTSSSFPGSLQQLVHSILGVQSLVKREPLKHNFLDRDRILVPPKWDSWGKIRVLRENFDVDGVSSSWTKDIQAALSERQTLSNGHSLPSETYEQVNGNHEDNNSAVAIYESTIHSPTAPSSATLSKTDPNNIEIESIDTQKFLASQLEILQKLRAEDDAAAGTTGSEDSSSRAGLSAARQASYQGTSTDSIGRDSSADDHGRSRTLVNEHIGPVQTNVGGISMNADDMLQQLKEREKNRSPDRDITDSPATPHREQAMGASPDGKVQNEALASFFAGLINRGGPGTGAKNSPKTPR